MKSPHPTPILKKAGRDSVGRRFSVTFSQEKDAGSEESKPSLDLSCSTGYSTEMMGSTYGLCYVPPTPSLPMLAKLPPEVELATLEEAQRPECSNDHQEEYHVLIVGDVVHGQCLKKELESSSLCHIQVTLCAAPTAENMKSCCFFLVLLPLEIVGSCDKVSRTLDKLCVIRADFRFRCAVVAVTTSPGRDKHITELLNLHTLLLNHNLSYYVWNEAVVGSWPGVLERLVMEISLCRREPAASTTPDTTTITTTNTTDTTTTTLAAVTTNPTATDTITSMGPGVTRAVLSSLLLPRDESSPFLEEYLDVKFYRTKQDLHI